MRTGNALATPALRGPREPQFFIMVEDAPHLNSKYTVFGEVMKGIEVADKIVAQPRDTRDNPLERIEMTVRIVE